MAVIIQGERINLRTPRRSDAPEVYEQVRKPAIRRFTFIPKPAGVEDTQRFIRYAHSSLKKKTDLILAIEEQSDGRIIGMIGLHKISAKNRNCELGYWLNRKYWGTGLTSEAVRMTLSYAFRKMKMRKVYSEVTPANVASIKVLEKNGFSNEGCSREHLFHSGKWLDLNFYGLLREEFEGRQPLIPMALPVDSRSMKVTRNVVAEGGIINLREFMPSDACSVASYCRDPHVARFVLIPQPYKPEDAVAYIRRTRRAYKTKSSISFAIEDSVSGEAIGGITLMNIDHIHKRAELAYILSRRYWGTGIITEAVKLMTAYGFRSLRLHRIYARVFHPNLPSMQVLLKNGYFQEGIKRRVTFHRRHWYDEHMFGILKREYDLLRKEHNLRPNSTRRKKH